MTDRLERLRQAATRPRRTVAVLLDGEAREQIEAVEDELDRLDAAPASSDRRLGAKSDGARRQELEDELERLRTGAEESTLYVVLEGMQATAYRALIADHPPRRDGDGKLVDLSGANLETLAEPLVRSCAIGYREANDAAAEVKPFPPDMIGYAPNEDAVTVGWLLGFTYRTPEGEERTVEPFVTERQLDVLSSAAFRLCRGDDAVPLPRKRSKTPSSDGG